MLYAKLLRCSRNNAAKPERSQVKYYERWNLPFNASNIMKMNAELGALLATVIPQPRYSPLRPYCRQIATPSCQNRALGPTEWTEVVCIRDLIVSAGKKRKLYDIPADAPAMACCQRGSGAISAGIVDGEVVAEERDVDGREDFWELRRWKRRVTVSLEPNQAAQPPVSRINVPS